MGDFIGSVDWVRVNDLIDQLYSASGELEGIFPGRKFSLDGHLVGSIGEVVAAFMFDLKLNPASTEGFDAVARDDKQVEIKLTQGTKIGIRHEPPHLLVFQKKKGEKLKIIYNGDGARVWNNSGKMQKNGQRSITISKLVSLQDFVEEHEKLVAVQKAPI